MDEQIPALEATEETTAQAATETTAQAARVYDEEYVKALRKEAADRRGALKRAEEELQRYRQAEMSEQQRAQAQAEAAQQERDRLAAALQAERVRSAIASSGADLGISKPGELAALINPAALEYDEDGQPSNVDAVLKRLLKAVGGTPGAASSPANVARGQQATPFDPKNPPRLADVFKV